MGEGTGNPLQYSCLQNPMDGEARWAIVHGVAKSQTWLRNFTFTFHFMGFSHSEKYKYPALFFGGECGIMITGRLSFTIVLLEL